MNIRIYNEEITLVANFENRYISCLWVEGFNSMQKCVLEVADTPFSRERIKEEYFVGRDDRKTVFVIKKVEYKDKKIIASGNQATRVLDDVAMISTINEGVLIDKTVFEEYNKSSKYKMLRFENTSLNIKSKLQISNKSFLEVSEKLAQASDLGFKVLRGEHELIAKFYNPNQKPKKVLAEDFGNLTINSLFNDKSSFKNYAIVLGEGLSKERIRVDVDMTKGEERRELIVDARDLQQDDEESLEAYKQRLQSRGMEKLLEHQGTFTVDLIPSAKDFGKVYDLGDTVTVKLPEYGLKLTAKIVRFQQKVENNQTETLVEVGKIQVRRK